MLSFDDDDATSNVVVEEDNDDEVLRLSSVGEVANEVVVDER
jgi:hypothetical protein